MTVYPDFLFIMVATCLHSELYLSAWAMLSDRFRVLWLGPWISFTTLNDLLIRYWAHCNGLSLMERTLREHKEYWGTDSERSQRLVQSRVTVR